MKKRFFAIAASIVMGVVSLAGISTIAYQAYANAKTATPTELDTLIQDTYKYNEVLDVPEITIEGATKVSTVLIYPDGTAKKATQLRLDQPGEYRLRYTYELKGKTQYFEKKFNVKFGLYYFSGEGETKSYASYTKFNEYGEDKDLKFPNGPLTIPFSDETRYPSTGLLVNLAQNETFTFSEPVSVDRFDGSEFMNIFAVPYAQFSNDYKQIFVRLTDAEDPNCYLTFRIHKITFALNSYESISAITVAGDNQIYTGLEIKSGTAYKWHRNDPWGCLIDHTFQASTNDGGNGYPSYKGDIVGVPSNYGQIALGYDNNTKGCYTSLGAGYNSKAFGKKTLAQFSDLDSPEAYDDAWGGFKSDKVYVSISLGEYSGTMGRFMIPNYLFADDLSQEYLDDVTAPKLVVNTPYAPNDMPKAYVGKYYTVPSATAFDDLCGKIKVDTTVDYNYQSGKPSSVKVENGKFKVDRIGSYRITYNATDAFGNASKACYYVNTSDDIEDISINLDGMRDTYDLGEVFKYQKPTITGGSGEKEYKVYLIRDDEKIDITDAGEKILDTYGSYKVRYEVKDFAGGEAVYEKALHVYVTDKYFIYDTPEFDPYLFNNIPTKLPLVYAYTYAGGEQSACVASVEVKYGGQANSYASGEYFTPIVSNNKDEIEITYYAGSSRFETVSRSVIDIGNADRLKIKNYFMGAEDTITADDKGLKFINSGENKEISWIFANKFLLNNNSISLGNIYENKKSNSELKTFEFSYIDTQNSAKTVTATVNVGLDKLIFNVSDTIYTVSYAFNQSSKNSMSVGYYNGNIVFSDASSSINMPVTTYDDGSAFDGFQSSSISVGLKATGIEANNGYYLYSIGGCPVSKYTVDDTIAPYSYSAGTTFGSYPINTVYTVNPAYGSDVLAPQVDISISVVAPNGDYVTSIDGVLLENADSSRAYQFTLEQYGMYQIIVKCVEVNWHWQNQSTNMKNVESIDDIAPVIKVLEEVKSEVKLNDIVYVPKFKVSDNATEEKDIKIFVTVIYPNIRELEVDMNGGFKATMLGTYYLMITARDSANNLATVQFAINCVE